RGPGGAGRAPWRGAGLAPPAGGEGRPRGRPAAPVAVRAQDPGGVAFIDGAFRLWREPRRFESLYRKADVKTAAFAVERKVAAPEHVIDPEELHSRLDRAGAAVEPGVGVEHPEVVDGMPGHPGQHLFVVLVTPAAAK